MTVLPPFLLVLDISALIAGRTRDWQEFSHLGECLVPKAVLDEIQFLCDRAPEPTVAATAKEFTRFFPTSGWRVTTSIASHPALQPAEGYALSHKARLALAVAQSVYGLARNRPEGLVVLIANDQGLLQRLRMLNMPNLCGMPLAALVHWVRTQRKPPVVSHQLLLRSLVGVAQPAAVGQPVRTAVAARPVAVEPKPRPVRRVPDFSAAIGQLISTVVMAALVAIAGLTAWRILQPASFHTWWKQSPLPEQLKSVVEPH